MTLTIELTPEEEARLTAQAGAQGKLVEELLRSLIAQMPSEPSETPTPRRALPRLTTTPEERLAARCSP